MSSAMCSGVGSQTSGQVQDCIQAIELRESGILPECLERCFLE